MLELFGFAWVTITFTCCVAAVSTRRSVLRWVKARTDRKRLDDTVEIVRRPMRRLATYAALVVLAVPAGVLAGGGALPGPSGGGGGLPTTGGLMTGQIVSSGVSVDWTSGTNEDLTIAPNGTGSIKLDPSGAGYIDAVPDGDRYFRVLQNSKASTQEVGIEYTVSDATPATYYWKLMNGSATDAVFAPVVRSSSTCTTAQNCAYYQHWLAAAQDSSTSPVIFVSAARNDGSSLTGRTALWSLNNGGTEVIRFARGGALVNVPSTTTVADNGAGTNASATITPGAGAGAINVTCNDANGCDLTISETDAVTGQKVTFRCTATAVSNFADTAGVTELAGAFACGQYDTIMLEYLTDRWVEVARSNN